MSEKYTKREENILHTCGLFKDLGDPERDLVLDELMPQLQSYQKNEAVLPEWTVTRSFGLVLQGALAAEKFFHSGEIRVVGLYEPGDLFGLENAVSRTNVSPVSVVALQESSVMWFDIERAFSGAHAEQIRDNVLHYLADECIRQLYKLDVLSRPGIRERVLAFLRIMAAKNGSNTFRIRMTQERFAQYLSVNRSALSSELNAMRREGLIDFKRDQYTLKI